MKDILIFAFTISPVIGILLAVIDLMVHEDYPELYDDEL